MYYYIGTDGFYWSSTDLSDGARAYGLEFGGAHGAVITANKTVSHKIRAVRATTYGP
ncbi:hypothetical protein GAMM_60243 [Gammaproteobacteria bacterium]